MRYCGCCSSSNLDLNCFFCSDLSHSTRGDENPGLASWQVETDSDNVRSISQNCSGSCSSQRCGQKVNSGKCYAPRNWIKSDISLYQNTRSQRSSLVAQLLLVPRIPCLSPIEEKNFPLSFLSCDLTVAVVEIWVFMVPRLSQDFGPWCHFRRSN